MKVIISLILILPALTTFSRANDFQALLDSGKAEFRKQFDKQDFARAVDYLEKATQIRPENTEARYFLGYAYSRLNSKDGESMINMSWDLTEKSSEQFEELIRISNKYNGEILALSPYSKITAEWGSLAMSYFCNGKKDSALLAFDEGKRRGGFDDFLVSLNKAVLDRCGENSYLISSGDLFTFTLWYLQIAENYRTDVSVIDISLLNTHWYPKYLSMNAIAGFDLSSQELDTINYCRWKDSTVTVSGFSWTVKPSYYDEILLRGDRIFLSLLKADQFSSEINFTIAFDEAARLSLSKYLENMLVIDRLDTGDQIRTDLEDYHKNTKKALSLSSLANRNNPDQLNLIDNLRYNVFNRILAYLDDGDIENSHKLLLLIDKYANEEEYPYQSEEGQKYARDIRAFINKYIGNE